ncbi:SDR family oxidoreductase [Lentilactobacillus sp. SPB1-3]|uniref:SDR family oxidoreductase n=1 Tax=Lentilactobacillus terminaliae TaxID=3003483 RepID=A0ACD5DEL5_9LACO|nr:aldehyde reductase [Lentilactobacillus sp. SPB1-3]MCZ0977693.1 aldehyde reductase [Lentilactobacillus sp. SPB1-3]
MSKHLVVVTGATGFIASHTIAQLLKQDYQVRATVRSLSKADLVKSMLSQAGVEDFDQLSFVEADLTNNKNWDKVMENADYVMSVASSTPTNEFTDADAMTTTAINGNIRVLTHARDAGVKRVVITSAYGAIGMGHTNRTTPFTEKDWTNLDNSNLDPYQRSKTLAEKASWNFIEAEGNGLEMAAINPVGVMGPVLSSDFSHSNQQIVQLLSGQVPAVPNINSGYIDVRDVASLHILAMTSPKANGGRFLATTGETLSMLDVANILRDAFPNFEDKLPTTVIPDDVLKEQAKENPMLKMMATLVGNFADTSNEKAKTLLGWNPRSAKEAIIATAQSMIDLGIVK